MTFSTIGAITATRNLEVSGGTFTLDANDSVADTVSATSGGTLTLHANTTAQNASLSGNNATLNTVATSNLSSFVTLNGAGDLLDLGADLNLTGDLDIRGAAGTPSIVQANGNNITARDIFIGRFGNPGDILNDSAITATRNLEVSGGTFTLDANDSVTDTVLATSGGTLTLHANTAAMNANLSGTNATLNTVATTNLSAFVTLNGAGDLLDMGADLNLSGDLDIRGTAGTPSIVQANGNNITARDIFVGRFANGGELLNVDLLTSRDLNVERSSLLLDGGFDTVGRTLSVFDASTLTVTQAADSVRGLSVEGATVNILDTSVLSLNFDSTLNDVGDWVFRWANPTVGDRVAAINAFIGSGRIVVNSTHAFNVVDNGDGYTYVALFLADYNNDERLNCGDIDLLTAAIVAGSTDLMFDLTGDGMVTVADRDAWLAGDGGVFLRSGNPFLPGDGNLDGVVDTSDFNIWNSNKFTANSAWCSGDFNTDGVVDTSDFNIWNSNKFTSADRVQAVPEPVSGWLALAGGLVLSALRRRSRDRHYLIRAQHSSGSGYRHTNCSGR